jgi:hypothetical protein
LVFSFWIFFLLVFKFFFRRMVSCFVWIAPYSFSVLLPKVCRPDPLPPPLFRLSIICPENQRQWGISVICQRCSLPITNRP